MPLSSAWAAALLALIASAGSEMAARRPAHSALAPQLRAIPELRWLAGDADMVAALTLTPVECLAPVIDEASRLEVEIGRAAFRAPGLLGGQAARAGLSCSGCHRNGRSNPQFYFPGVSGAPGSADVTSSLFSSHRGDGKDNPVPIPDLAAPTSELRIDRHRPGELEAFIRGLVIEEFDGPEPTADVLRGLAGYVRALRPDACDQTIHTEQTVEAGAGAVRRAVRAARFAPDVATRLFLLSAARAELERLHQRFTSPVLAATRASLSQSSRVLGQLQSSLREGREILQDIHQFESAFDKLERELVDAKHKSLFDPDVVRAAVAESMTGRSTR